MPVDTTPRRAGPGAPGRGGRAGRRRRIRTPLFLQNDETECGAVCLGIVLAHFGRWVPIDELRRVCGVGRDGSTALGLQRGAEKYGLRTDGWRKETSGLSQMSLPLIIFWEFNHFVVLEGIGNGKYYLNDPANGRLVVSEDVFDRAFTGITLEMTPSAEFEPGGERRGILSKAWPWLSDAKATVAYALLCGLLLAAAALVSPILLTVFVDYVLLDAEPGWTAAIVIIGAIVTALTYAVTWMQQRSLQRLAIRLSTINSERVLSHLFRLPAKFYAHRFMGDLAQRMQIIDQIAEVISKQFMSVIVELVMSSLFLILMMVYDPLLASAVLLLAILNAALTRVAGRRRADENRGMQHEQARLAGLTAFGMGNLESLRATSMEKDFFLRWSGYQARELTVRQSFAELGYIIASLPNLFLLLGAAVVFGVGGLRVAAGDLTVGSLMGFYIVSIHFLQPVGRFVQSIDAFQVLESELDRIEDINSAAEDPLIADSHESESGTIATVDGRLRLHGRIELRDITFGYRPDHPPLIKGFNLIVEPGQRIALIGTTGSGKSTLMKLAMGEFAPWSGEVLFDDKPVHTIPRQVLTDSVAVVDQHILLYSGTVRENLTMWNPAVPDRQVAAAARDAMIHDEIVSRPYGYDGEVAEGGVNLSHGQRQRLEIARALALEPSVLLLDEATSRLDAVTEMEIDSALRRRGCTCLIVAHRLSTIRDCDQIIVLDVGRVAQRGTHDELIADERGLYFQLVHSV